MVAKWLITSGFNLSTLNKNGQQHGFETANGRIQGHADGIINGLPPEVQTVDFGPLPWLWECKTMNNKNWLDVQKRGVFVSRFVYYVQVQIYMAYMDLNACLFTSLNKDTAELYIEIIKQDLETAQKYSDRAVNLLNATDNKEMLPRLSKSPSFFKCKMCGYQEACWKTHSATEKQIETHQPSGTTIQ